MDNKISNRKKIDLNTYTRKSMFEHFSKKAFPVFSTCATLDITLFKDAVQKNDKRFFACMTHVLSSIANAIPAFRHRIIDGVLYEYDVIHPGYTVLLNDDSFGFAHSLFHTSLEKHHQQTIDAINNAQKNIPREEIDAECLFYITSIPWFSFTSFTHPYDVEHGSIPIITLGKYFKEDGKIKMPVGIQVHHGVLDGAHVGAFYQMLQEKLDNSNL